MSTERRGRQRTDRLARARVVIVGAGGLGSPVALSLAAAGVGNLVLCDNDVVDLSNLQRQTLFREADVGHPKAVVAARRLAEIAPSINVEAHTVRLDSQNAWDIVDEADVVVDGSDNFPTHFLVNDLCVLAEIPLVSAGLRQWLGQVTTILPGKTACYRCLFEEPPLPGEVPSCAEAGVLGALAGAIGALQAREALALVLGEPPALLGRLCTFEAQTGLVRLVELSLRRDCAVCGDAATIRSLDPHRYGAAPCPAQSRTITCDREAARLDSLVKETP